MKIKFTFYIDKEDLNKLEPLLEAYNNEHSISVSMSGFIRKILIEHIKSQ